METIKLASRRIFSGSCSYPTYEEWKPRRLRCQREFCILVLILPMRNGNERYRWIWRTLSVLILPMRNGNDNQIFQYLVLSFLFLSYLWGMETILNFLFSPKVQNMFLSYLWGMETLVSIFYNPFVLSVLILPMRNGNCYHLPETNLVLTVLILPMRNGN